MRFHLPSPPFLARARDRPHRPQRSAHAAGRSPGPLAGRWGSAFVPVADELARQLGSSPATGAALCVYHRGQVVVDAWGGVRNSERDPWCEDTLVMAFSTGKGVAATLFHTLVDA